MCYCLAEVDWYSYFQVNSALSEAYGTRLLADIGSVLTTNLPNLDLSSTLKKINLADKCLWYFHPSLEVTAVKFSGITKDVQLLILTCGLVA